MSSCSPEAAVQARRQNFPEDFVTACRLLSPLALVESLGEGLTSESSEVASACVGCVWRSCLCADGSQRCDVDAGTVSVIVKFLAERCLSFLSADEAFEGLKCIVHAYVGDLPDDAVVGLGAEWLPSIGVQRQSVRVRTNVFDTLRLLVDRRPESLGRAGPSLLRGFVEAADGERDPTNVLKAFTLAPMIVKLAPAEVLAFHAADLFDNLAAYFPVMFSPPAGCSVTKAQLRDALHEAMTLPQFAELCLPFVVGKLSSPAAGTKVDCLDVIQRCFRDEQTADASRQHVGETCVGLRSEVLRLTALGSGGDREMLQQVLGTLCRVGASLHLLASEDILSSLSSITTAAVNNVETGSPAGRAYATMVHALAAASPNIARALYLYLCPLVVAIATQPASSAGQEDNAAAMVAGLLAACERCYASGRAMQAPDAKTTKTCFDFATRMLHSTRSFSRTTGADALTIQCVLGHHNDQWISDEEATLVYEALIRATFQDADPKIASSLANAARVDGERVAQVLGRVRTTLVAPLRTRSNVGEALIGSGSAAVAVQVVSVIASGADESNPDDREHAWSVISAACECARAGAKGPVLELVQRVLCVPCQSALECGQLAQALTTLLLDCTEEEVKTLISRASDDQFILGAAAPLSMDLSGQVDFGRRTERLIDQWQDAVMLQEVMLPLAIAHCSVQIRSNIVSRLDPASCEIGLLAKVIKGLCMKGDEGASALQAALVARLSASPSTWRAAVQSLLAPPKPTKGVAFMWEQRLVFVMIARLRDSDLPNASRMAALAELVKSAQSDHVRLALKEIVPLSIAAIDDPDAGPDAICVLHDAAESDEEEVCPLILAQKTTLLAIAQLGASATQMGDRERAFNLLTKAVRFASSTGRVTQLLSLRQDIMKVTRRATDDPKRIVRQAAAKCRHYWMLLDSQEA